MTAPSVMDLSCLVGRSDPLGSRALHFTVMRKFLRRPTSICPRSTNVSASPHIRCILCSPQERDAARDSAGVIGCKIHTLWQGQIPWHQVTYRNEHLRKSLWGTFLWGAAGATFRLGASPWSQAEERVSSSNPAAEPVDVRGIDVTRRPPPGDSRPAAVLLDASRVSASRRWRVCLVDPPTLGAPPHLLHVCATAVTEARSLLSFVHHFHITNRALWCR